MFPWSIGCSTPTHLKLQRVAEGACEAVDLNRSRAHFRDGSLDRSYAFRSAFLSIPPPLEAELPNKGERLCPEGRRYDEPRRTKVGDESHWVHDNCARATLADGSDNTRGQLEARVIPLNISSPASQSPKSCP